ncbi:hypothetical protein FRC09_011052 [Ceratobasidium sp. 395]|nr:hypothetical protein FRC09_011052 [Ceratobasidium sp. 395]
MTRVSEIHVTSCKSKFPNYMLDVLALWAREGAAKPARLLKIGDHKSAFGDINLRGRLSHTAQPVTTDNFEAFFQSLHTLHLHRAFIPWDSSVYYGLVDLYLTAGAHSPQQWFPTQSQLARVLAACPKLRSLRLIDFTVRLDRDLIPSPIILDHLEVLSLLQPNSFDYKIMKRVLPLIGSSSSSFEVSLKLNMETDFTAITRSFFSRCNLTRLHLSAQNLPVQCILPLLAGHVPRLETLSLKRFDFTDGTTQQRTAMGVNPTSDSWPQLRELHLIRCVLNSDHGQIRRLLQHYPIRKLYLSNCTRKYGTPAELMKEIEAVRCLAKRLGVLEVVTKDGDDDDNGGSGDEDDDDEI